jgi:hypothetical protein
MAGAAAGGSPERAPARQSPAYTEATPFQRPPQVSVPRGQLTDLDIPTFIRRQMD